MKKFIKYTAGVFLGCTMLTSFVCAKTFEESAAEILGKIQTYESSEHRYGFQEAKENLQEEFLRLVGGLNPQHKYSGRKPTEAEKAIVATFAALYVPNSEIFTRVRRHSHDLSPLQQKSAANNINAVEKASDGWYNNVAMGRDIPSENHTVFDNLLKKYKADFAKGRIPSDVQRRIDAQKEERTVGSAVSSLRKSSLSGPSTLDKKPTTQRGTRVEAVSSGKPGGSISSFDPVGFQLFWSSLPEKDKKLTDFGMTPTSERVEDIGKVIEGSGIFSVPKSIKEKTPEVKIAASADSTSSYNISSSSDSSSPASAEPKELDYTKLETFKDNLILQKGASLKESFGKIEYSFTVTAPTADYYRKESDIYEYKVNAPKTRTGFLVLKSLIDVLERPIGQEKGISLTERDYLFFAEDLNLSSGRATNEQRAERLSSVIFKNVGGSLGNNKDFFHHMSTSQLEKPDPYFTGHKIKIGKSYFINIQEINPSVHKKIT